MILCLHSDAQLLLLYSHKRTLRTRSWDAQTQRVKPRTFLNSHQPRMMIDNHSQFIARIKSNAVVVLVRQSEIPVFWH